LVVDDEPSTLGLTQKVLQDAGYDVVTASSGLAALAALRRQGPFDLLLLDINMPGMDGWETLHLVRVDETTARLPVVMFSVKYQIRDKVHAMQQGAADYVTKPFEVDELIARVGRVLDPPGENPASPPAIHGAP
jgi:DNA-binding response OmpR family regulator